MSSTMQVRLSREAAPSVWGDKAVLSFNGNEAIIHLGVNPLRTIQQAARKLESSAIRNVTLIGADWDVERRFAFACGFYAGKGERSLDFGAMSDAEAQTLKQLDENYQWAREMINAAPAAIYPQSLAEAAIARIKAVAGELVTAKMIVGDELLAAGHMGIWNVGSGSDKPPVLLELDYNPTGNPDAPVVAALVGKGITFDSGGYSIKGSDMMLPMKSDMGGAALVTAGLALAIQRGLNQRVRLYLCCAENLISGKAYKLGDIISYRNGIKVEIQNTDAEGRLVLADGLMCAADAKARYILDAATLTGAAKMAIGREYNAVFALDQTEAQRVLDGARRENEMAWQLPLELWHQEQLPSSFADLSNISTAEGSAGASTAAAFLSRFVPDQGKGWVHLDLAGCYQKSGNDLWATGAKGHGLRTIANWLESVAKEAK